jgi:hypothetical protein
VDSRHLSGDFPLIHTSAEDPPPPDGSFDLVFSEYGATSGAPPPRGAHQAPARHRLEIEALHELYAPEGDPDEACDYARPVGPALAVRGRLGGAPHLAAG